MKFFDQLTAAKSLLSAREVAPRSRCPGQNQNRKKSMLRPAQSAKFSDNRSAALYELGLRPSTSIKWAEHVTIL